MFNIDPTNPWKIRVDYDASQNIIYHGYAKPGAAEGDPVWIVFKDTLNGSGSTTATDVANSVDWTNRATHTYA